METQRKEVSRCSVLGPVYMAILTCYSMLGVVAYIHSAVFVGCSRRL